MARFLSQWLSIASLTVSILAFADFGTITQPSIFEPTFAIPRPHQLPEDVWMRYGPFSSRITAIAPSIRVLHNGSQETSWSMHSRLQPTRTLEHPGLRKRGVFSGSPPLVTCRPCDGNGNPVNTNNNSTNGGVPSCSIQDYDGVLRSGVSSASALPDYCFNAGYTGVLEPSATATNAGLPCCPSCYPAGNNTTATFTGGGVFNTTSPMTGDVPTVTVTETATATEPVTITRVTLSIETITPPASITESPVITTALATVVGCGTASGCGTVNGSGTVYIAPFGFPAVTSSGIVTGCAPKVVGCGEMIAEAGIFTGSATITACGEGTGSATMVGSGTVWPAGFMDLISFVSSGTVTGSGRVRGCGTLIGTGTFTVTAPYTTTITPSATPTVNIYVSYCPPDQNPMNPLMGLAGNFSDAISPALAYNSNPNPKYALDPVLAGAGGNFSLANATDSVNATGIFDNIFCHICPQDSGICCPPYTDCGADGHCPWTALEACGYARFGVNLVDVRNSSQSMGMDRLPDGAGYARLRAPGLPGSQNVTVSEYDAAKRLRRRWSWEGPLHAQNKNKNREKRERRRLLGQHGHGHGHEMRMAGRVGIGLGHGHDHGH